MCPLFESIRVEGGQAYLLQCHQARIEHSYMQLFQKECPWKLISILPELPTNGLHKLRFIYNKRASSFEIAPDEAQKIESLKCVEINTYEKPLFKCVQREYLFGERIIKVGEIHMENLTKQESFQLVNTLNPFKQNQLIPIGEIG